MNILLIGQYRVRGDGWTEATRSLIKSIQTIKDVNLTITNINMANKPPQQELEFKHLEKKQNKFDVVLQKVIPSLYYYNADFGQNIGLNVFETELPKSHPYIYKISNLLDKATVTTQLEKDWLSSYTNTPVFAIGEAIDIDKYKNTFQPIHPIFQDKSVFKFLFSGEATERKNLDALLKAYLTEFNYNENVALVVKTNNDVAEQVNRVKKGLRISNDKYPITCLINQPLTDEQMASLHQYSDCLVVPSKGESFCRGAAESIAAGKPVITTDNIGTSYIVQDGGWLVNSRTEQCYCEQSPLPELYSGLETWEEISVLDLRRCMREALNKEIYQEKCNAIKNFELAKQFAYETIGYNLYKAITA